MEILRMIDDWLGENGRWVPLIGWGIVFYLIIVITLKLDKINKSLKK